MGGSKADRNRADKKFKREEAVPAPVPRYEAPPAEICETHEFEVEMPDSDYRIVQRLQFHQGRIVEFAIVLYSVLRRGRAREVYSVDTRHGTFHEHPTGHQTPEKIVFQPMYSQVDVQESFDFGYRKVEERYVKTVRG